MLLPASTSITMDTSSALVVRRLYISGPPPDASPKLASQLMIGGRCLLRTGVVGTGFVGFCCRNQQQHLYAYNAMGDHRHCLPKIKRRRYPVATNASLDRGGPLEPNNHSSSRKAQAQPCYHPSEDIGDSPSDLRGEDGEKHEDQRLTDAEMARTVIELNDKATLIFSESIDDEIEEKILWPELSYITDEHGGIYIEVNKEDDALQILTANDNLVQILIGIDNIENIAEVELSGPTDIHLRMEEFMDEELDIDDDFGQDTEMSDFDDADDEDYDDFSSEPFVDWTNLETMKSSHPVYFANKIEEAVSNIQFNWMDQPSTSVIIQGFLRPAFVDDHSIINEQYPNTDEHPLGKITPREPELADDGSHRRVMFYMVELITIQLASANGNLSLIKVQDYRQAQPDVIAHSAARIISRIKSDGEKTTEALKSLCLRCKGIQVEEVNFTGVDSLGFDLRACSGTQIQNLRFSFSIQATSEYSAERQLNDLLFPRVQTKSQGKKQAPRKES